MHLNTVYTYLIPDKHLFGMLYQKHKCLSIKCIEFVVKILNIPISDSCAIEVEKLNFY